jgi:hypothetical protein
MIRIGFLTGQFKAVAFDPKEARLLADNVPADRHPLRDRARRRVTPQA